jgi:Kef-type K+ transport system membrane component KefB
MDYSQSVIHIVFLIFGGAAILATVALFTRQSLLIAYILLGAVLGPWGLKLIKDSALVKQTGDVGILFLLFLLGLNLQPQNLLHSLRKMSSITFTSSLIFLIVGFAISFVFGLDFKTSLLVGITMMFSSTIIGLKLLPTTILHHQHTGELMVSILLLQDIIAIGVLLVLQGVAAHEFAIGNLLLVIIAFPVLLFIAYVFERFALSKLMTLYDKIHEYIFILSIGWCLFMAEIAHYLGLSGEIGAFIAGVALATTPISFYIAENLKPLRDFFLIIFFFSIGAGFNFSYLPQVILPATLLAAFMLLIKPYTFLFLLKRAGESKATGWEIGVRLGQISEFSLLVIYLALQVKLISPQITYMVEAATILTFIISSYWVVMHYPTPMAASDKLRRD